MPHAIQVKAGRIIAESAAGAGDKKVAIIGTGADHAVLENNRAAIPGADQAGIHVPGDVTLLALGVFWGKGLVVAVLAERRQAAKRDQVIKGVTRADLEDLGDRPQPMSGVVVAVAGDVRLAAPEPFGNILEEHLAQIVDVSALGMGDRARPGENHALDNRLPVIVTAVFEHDTVAAGALGGFNKLPALLETYRGGNLNPHVFAGLHGSHGKGGMQIPGSGDVDQVQVLLEETLPGIWTAEVERRGLARITDLAGGAIGVLGAQISDGFDLHAFTGEKLVKQVVPARRRR